MRVEVTQVYIRDGRRRTSMAVTRRGLGFGINRYAQGHRVIQLFTKMKGDRIRVIVAKVIDELIIAGWTEDINKLIQGLTAELHVGKRRFTDRVCLMGANWKLKVRKLNCLCGIFWESCRRCSCCGRE